MARYSLIMRDKTFVTLMQKAMSEQKTLGKYLNELLNDVALKIDLNEYQAPVMTCRCGAEATIKEFPEGEDKPMFVCDEHHKKGVSFKRVER